MVAPCGSASVLVVAGPGAEELEELQALPNSAKVVAVGRTLEDFSSLTDDQWGSINVLLNCGVGPNAASREQIQELWPKLSNLTWMHSASAGLEHLLFPELVSGAVQLTNAKGIYSHSLAEYCLAACNWFAKDFPRWIRNKAERRWEKYPVEELRGRTLGVVGYGDIGRATARIARAFGMRIIALRRRTDLSAEEQAEGLVDAVYGPDRLLDLMAASDYVVVATPYTPATHGLVSAAAIAAMKTRGVLINVGRGKCVDEEALIQALHARRIRGAALDVFATEPLPSDSPLWGLDNVFISAHNADLTHHFQRDSLRFFVENMRRFLEGQALENVVDKAGGY